MVTKVSEEMIASVFRILVGYQVTGLHSKFTFKVVGGYKSFERIDCFRLQYISELTSYKVHSKFTFKMVGGDKSFDGIYCLCLQDQSSILLRKYGNHLAGYTKT